MSTPRPARDVYQVTLTVYVRARAWSELKSRIGNALRNIGCCIDFVHYEIDQHPVKLPPWDYTPAGGAK